MNQKITSRFIAQGAMIAAAYVALATLIGAVGTRLLLHKALSAHRESIFLKSFL